MELRHEDRLILSSVKIQPSPEELDEINVLIPLIQDWEYLISTIIDRGIGPLLFKKLPYLTNSSQIPESFKIKLQQVYYKTFSRSTILYEHFRKIAEAFALNEIPLIALKGIYLSEWLYQDIGLRQFSDIDLLVNKEDGVKCLSILFELGFKPAKYLGKLSKFVNDQLDMRHYPQMVLEGVSVEIHIKLHTNSEKYDVIVHELWRNSIMTITNGIKINTLGVSDLLIHLCIHLDKHFREGKVQFTCFIDITNLLERSFGTLNWDDFTVICKLYKCEYIVFEYIIMSNYFMNAPVPNGIIQKYSFLLTKKDRHLFLKYLRGKVGIKSALSLSDHFLYLKNNLNFSNKIKYLSLVLFPSKTFMIERYKIKIPTLVLFYYPYRYYIGVMGLVNHLLKKR